MNLRITRHATADHDRARELAATRLDEALAAERQAVADRDAAADHHPGSRS